MTIQLIIDFSNRTVRQLGTRILTLGTYDGNGDALWGQITGTITNQLDLIARIGVNEVTYSELTTLVNDSELKPLAYYKITDAQSSHVSIPLTSQIVMVQAISANELSTKGIVWRLVPDYTISGINLGIWHSALTPSVGDKVIYGERVWENLLGNVGSVVDYLNLDPTEWEEVPYVDGADYTYKAYDCQYDFPNDFIESLCYHSIKVGANHATWLNTGLTWNPCDRTDINQIDNYSLAYEVYAGLGILNNPNLSELFFVNALSIFNNLCITIADCVLISANPKIEYNQTFGINDNECAIIKKITNINSINAIPASVPEYSWVTDDETGYIELLQLSVGTHIIGCIIPNNATLVEMIVTSDGSAADPTATIQIGITGDDPAYFPATLVSAINSAPVRVTTIGNRTTQANRTIQVVVGVAAITIDYKLKISYKYVS